MISLKVSLLWRQWLNLSSMFTRDGLRAPSVPAMQMSARVASCVTLTWIASGHLVMLVRCWEENSKQKPMRKKTIGKRRQEKTWGQEERPLCDTRLAWRVSHPLLSGLGVDTHGEKSCILPLSICKALQQEGGGMVRQRRVGRLGHHCAFGGPLGMWSMRLCRSRLCGGTDSALLLAVCTQILLLFRFLRRISPFPFKTVVCWNSQDSTPCNRHAGKQPPSACSNCNQILAADRAAAWVTTPCGGVQQGRPRESYCRLTG